MKMFNILLEKNGYPKIKAGIGLGCDKELIIKAGQSGSGINDKIWIGKAVVDACHLGNIANRKGISPIALSPSFYYEIKKDLENENISYKNWIMEHRSNGYVVDFYHCNIIETEFNDWIEEGML